MQYPDWGNRSKYPEMANSMVLPIQAHGKLMGDSMYTNGIPMFNPWYPYGNSCHTHSKPIFAECRFILWGRIQGYEV